MSKVRRYYPESVNRFLFEGLSRREFLRYSTAAAAAMCAGCRKEAGAKAEAEDSRPDVVLISIDSLRSDHLGCYGYGPPTTPMIDSIAKQGIRFANAFSTTSWTLPAHAALFTGLYDSSHGLVDNGMRLSSKHITLAELFTNSGYQTAGFFGGPYLHPTFGLNKGFQSYISCMSDQGNKMDDSSIRKYSSEPLNFSHHDVTGPRTLDKFSAWLDGADRKPLFAFLHMWDPHYDYIPPEKYAKMFDPDYTGTLDTSNYSMNKAIHAGLPPREIQHIKALYDGEIRFTDDILGRIFAKLKQRGRWENTLIIILADHGEEFFEHGTKGHSKTLYDEVIHVPLIFYWHNKLPHNKVIDEEVQIIDIMPTVLSLLGMDFPDYIQGRSLCDLFTDLYLPEKAVFCELLVRGLELRSLRTPREKIHQLHPDGPTCGYFNLITDPKEQKPIFVPNNESHTLIRQLDDTLKKCLALNHRITGSDSDKIQLDPEMQKRLKSLGYIGDETP